MVGTQRGFANTQADANNVMDSKGDASTPSASTSDGQVSVAAAIAINIGQETTLATIPDGVTIGSTTPLTVTAGGLLTLSASQTTLGTATANGSATGTGSGVAVGAGVAINLVHADAEGTIGYYHFSGSGSGPAATGAIVKSQGAALSATMSGSGTPDGHSGSDGGRRCWGQHGGCGGCAGVELRQ